MVRRGMRVEVVASGDDGWCRVGGDSGSDGCRVKKSAPKAGTSLHKATGASGKRLEPRRLRASVFGGYEDVASPRSEALGERVELWGHSLQEGSGVGGGGGAGTSSSSNTPPAVVMGTEMEQHRCCPASRGGTLTPSRSRDELQPLGRGHTDPPFMAPPPHVPDLTPPPTHPLSVFSCRGGNKHLRQVLLQQAAEGSSDGSQEGIVQPLGTGRAAVGS